MRCPCAFEFQSFFRKKRLLHGENRSTLRSIHESWFASQQLIVLDFNGTWQTSGTWIWLEFDIPLAVQTFLLQMSRTTSPMQASKLFDRCNACRQQRRVAAGRCSGFRISKGIHSFPPVVDSELDLQSGSFPPSFRVVHRVGVRHQELWHTSELHNHKLVNKNWNAVDLRFPKTHQQAQLTTILNSLGVTVC